MKIELASTLNRQRQVFALLADIVTLDDDAREAALAGVDAEIARQVRAMLDADAGRGHLLDPSDLAEQLAAAELLLRPGQKIGRSRVIETLGAGGVGTVYLAEQEEPVRRHVALKVLRVSLDGPETRQRFFSERHAMGRLDHPNIAKIFDAGATREGTPYLALELIDGEPITDYCDRHRLSIEARLRLFVQVCLGVDHIHRKFLLHRDVKPSNVLVTEVDGRPVPKLIDFGIVKGLDDSLVEGPRLTGQAGARHSALHGRSSTPSTAPTARC
ncbi:MAG: serine/threonine-protein kinase [Acidobacteriota bacterium]